MAEHGLDVLSTATEYLRNDLSRSASVMDPHDQHRPRKRRRAALSCEQCRLRKLKCDRNDPCGACVKSHLPACVYQNNHSIVGGQPTTSKSTLDPTPPYSTTSDPSHAYATALGRLPPTPAVTQSPSGQPSDPQQPAALPAEKLSAGEAVFYHHLKHINPVPLRGVRGTFTKGRLYGESHWTAYLTSSSIAIENLREIAREGFSDVYGVLGKCKALAREVKAQEKPDEDKLRAGDLLLPSRPVADMLVQAYTHTLETVFHILDLQQFHKLYEQYWNDPESVPRGFQSTLTLVFANAVAASSEHGINRKTVAHWIYLASEWLNHPKAKLRMDLWSLRTHCLLLLARLTNGIDGKMTALSAGSLVVTAMHMGLHVDPLHFAESQIPRGEREVRRRLWATVLELELQSTMDSGSKPLVREDDYDCAPPSNVNDHGDIGAPGRSTALPLEKYTQSSIQILLAKSMAIRLKIIRFVNDFRPGARYQEALALSRELVEEMRRSSTLIEGWRKSGAPISQFQTEMFNLLMHRFLLALHYSFALKAKDEPLFYYSRKVCLDSSLTLLSPPVSQRDPAFYRLALHGRSAFQDSYIGAANFLCEYISSERATGSYLFPTTSAPSNANLIAAMEGHVPLCAARIEVGETNVKAQVLFRAITAYAKAIDSGDDAKVRLRESINVSLQDAHAALCMRLEGASPPLEVDGGTLGEEISLESLFGWLGGPDAFGADDGGAWMNGVDWSVNQDGVGMGAGQGM